MVFDGQLAVFFSVFIVVYMINNVFLKKRNSKHLRYPPSLPSLPLVGSLPFLRNFSNISLFFMEKSYQLGPMFTFRVGNQLILTLNNREVIEEALVKNSRHFSSRPDIYADSLINPNKKGIIFMDNTPDWKRNHQVALTIMREFGFGVKSIMEERIMDEIRLMVKFIQNKKGQPFDPIELSVVMTSNVVSEIVFGYRRDYNLGISELVLDIERFVHSLDMAFDIAPFLRYVPIYKEKLTTLTNLKKKIYPTIEAEIENSLKNEENCFICRYVEKCGSSYDPEQLNYMVRDIIAAGSETSSTTFQWLLVVLANNPEIQKKLHNEIDSVVPRDRFPTIQDQPLLPYHEAVILEIFRWRTLVPMAVAHFTKGDSFLRGYFIPSGTIVLVNLNAVHSNKTDWKDPEVFRPERFLDNNNRVVGRNLVIPFGLGRRSCFGEILARTEVFLMVASLAQRFTVLPPEGQEKVSEKPKEPVTISVITEPFCVRLLDRN